MTIKVNNLIIERKGIDILNNLSICFKENKTNILLGKSGSGKTCLIKACVGLMSFNAGEIIVNKKHIISNCESNNISDIGFVFQSNALFDSLTIKENIIFGLDESSIDIKQIHETLKNVNLITDVLNKYPNEISGGMQKRVAIARSIIRQNKILILDEPTSGLDPITSNMIAQTLNNLSKNFKLTIICVTHDIPFANTVGNHFFLLDNKKIAWQGTSLDTNDVMISKYLNGLN